MAVIFDLDGTLLDSYSGILGSLRHTLEGLGIHGMSDREIAGWIGPSIYHSFAGAMPGATDDEVHAAVTAYRDHYADIGWKDCRPYAGVYDMLRDVRASGARMYVATAKAEYIAVKMTAAWELDPLVDGVHGSKRDGRHADKGDLLEYILEAEALDPRRCVMVGDRSSDILGAHRHGIRSVAVTWGYGSREELDGADATETVTAMKELSERLRGMGAGTLESPA